MDKQARHTPGFVAGPVQRACFFANTPVEKYFCACIILIYVDICKGTKVQEIESKSMFAKRIKKSVQFVSVYCKRGIFPINDRGFVLVEDALREFKKRRNPGRPKLKVRDKIVPVRVYVARKHRKAIIEMAAEYRRTRYRC